MRTAYLEIVIREKLATVDGDLRRAAAAGGVRILWAARAGGDAKRPSGDASAMALVYWF